MSTIGTREERQLVPVCLLVRGVDCMRDELTNRLEEGSLLL